MFEIKHFCDFKISLYKSLDFLQEGILKINVMQSKLIMIGLFIASILIVSCQTTGNKHQEKEVVASKSIQALPELSVIFQAALDGQTQTIVDAIDAGFDLNTLDENSRTVIMMAAYNGHEDIVKLLIEKGATVDAVDNVGRTALMFASTGPFVSTVSLLLEAGANPNLTEKEENWTAVMMAAAEGQLEVLKVLVANGADLSMVDVDKESCLDFAESKNHTAVVDYLKSLGVK